MSINFDTIYVFGDSFSDTGASGDLRTNGSTAAGYLAASLGTNLVLPTAGNIGTKSINFAETSAKVNTQSATGPTSLTNQVGNFSQLVGDGEASFDSEDTLFFLAGGLNDKNTPTNTVITGYKQQVTELVGLGARYIEIALLPTEIPRYTERAERLNAAYEDLVADLSARYSHVTFTLSDWGNYFDDIIVNPDDYGMTNVTDAYLTVADPGVDDPDEFFYYYEAHPSDAAHKAVGEQLYDEVQTIEESSKQLNVSGQGYEVTTFTQQSNSYDFNIYNSDNSLKLRTNAWIELEFPDGITVTEDTVLRFDFMSTNIGEAHGFEFDNDDRATSLYGFQLYGTETTTYRQDYNTYDAGQGKVTYEITVGEFFTGEFDTLVFFTEDDAKRGSNSTFENIELFERDGSYNNAPTGDQGNVSARIGQAVSINLAAAFSDSDGPDPLSFAVSGLPDGLSLSGGVISGTPAQAGDFAITVTVSDGDKSITDGFTLGVVDPDPGPATDLEISGTDYALTAFDQQNSTVAHSLSDGGKTLDQGTNAWTEVEIPGNFRVTRDTVLRFDFTSSDEGEMHGVEFDRNDRATSEHGFQIFGTQTGFYRQDFNDYELSDGTKTYEIEVGKYFTGRFDNIVFFTDDDVLGGSNSSYSNIELIDIA